MKIAKTAHASLHSHSAIKATGPHGKASLGKAPVRLDLTAIQQNAVEARAPIDSAVIVDNPPIFDRRLVPGLPRSALAGSPPLPRVISRAGSDSISALRMRNLERPRPARRSARTVHSSRAAHHGQPPEDVPRIPVSPEGNERNRIATGRVLTQIARSVRVPIARNRAQESGRSARIVQVAHPRDLVPADSSAEAPAVAAETRVRIAVACAPVAAVVPAHDPAANLAEANAAPESRKRNHIVA
jgi:hypothetical protein